MISIFSVTLLDGLFIYDFLFCVNMTIVFFFLGSHGFSVKKVVFKGSQCLYTTSAHILIMSFFQCNKLHCKLFNGLTQTIMNGQALGIGKVNVSLFSLWNILLMLKSWRVDLWLLFYQCRKTWLAQWHSASSDITIAKSFKNPVTSYYL